LQIGDRDRFWAWGTRHDTGSTSGGHYAVSTRSHHLHGCSGRLFHGQSVFLGQCISAIGRRVGKAYGHRTRKMKQPLGPDRTALGRDEMKDECSRQDGGDCVRLHYRERTKPTPTLDGNKGSWNKAIKVVRMRPRPPMSRHWTDDESRELAVLWPTHSVAEIARLLRRSGNSVIFRARRLSLERKHVPRSAPVKPDPQDFDAVKRDYCQNHGIDMVALIARLAKDDRLAAALFRLAQATTLARTSKAGKSRGRP
jgi:hypothetical protein